MRSTTRIAVASVAIVALAVPLAALATVRGGDEATAAAPSFTRDVAPIVAEKCSGCHQVGGIAPFPLQAARQISKQADAMAAAVRAGLMPPWPPGKLSPAYVGESARTLSAAQRATIVAWARAGAKVDGPAGKPARPAAPEVRDGETLLDLRLPAAYRPSAAKGVTDDYRCFLLDPKQAADAFVTSARIEPGQRKVVHHVILFRVAPGQVADAKALDARSRGQGWSCFGGTGLPAGDGSIAESLNNANWISAWAPGRGGNRLPEGTGVSLPAGSQIVMQVHYNLLNGRAPDRSRALLTVAPASTGLKSLQTVLLPGPVELACAKGEQGRLCDRSEALLELGRKYGAQAAFVPQACSCSAAAAQPLRPPAHSRGATVVSRRRRRSTSPPATCTCWARRSVSS